MVAYPRKRSCGFSPLDNTLSMSKSNPSTMASPKGRGPLYVLLMGPKASHRIVEKFTADCSFTIDWFEGMAPPSESIIFFPAVWHRRISEPILGQLLKKRVLLPSGVVYVAAPQALPKFEPGKSAGSWSGKIFTKPIMTISTFGS